MPLRAQDVDDSLHVVGQNMKTHLRTHLRHPEELDGVYPLPDEDGAEGEYGDESSCSKPLSRRLEASQTHAPSTTENGC